MALPSYIVDEMRRIGVQPPSQPSDLATTRRRSSSPGDWSPDQVSVARRIYDIGRQRNEPDDSIRAALSAGIVESEFNPRAVGDRDNPQGAAYGVLQQRRVGGYDTAKAADPDTGVDYAANAFYDNARNVRSYNSPGHLAAQVQRPRQDLWGRYDREMPRADALFQQFGGGPAVPQRVREEITRITGQTPAPDAPVASTTAPAPTVPDHVAAEIKRITSFTPSGAEGAAPASPDQAVTNTPAPAPAPNESNVSAARATAPSVRQQRPRALQPADDVVRTEATVDNSTGRPLALDDSRRKIAPDAATRATAPTAVKAIQFTPYDGEEQGKLARASQGWMSLSRSFDNPVRLDTPDPDEAGKAVHFRIPADEYGHLPSNYDVTLEAAKQIAPEMAQAVENYKRETGRDLWQVDTSRFSGRLIHDPKGDYYDIGVVPTRGDIDVANAYNQGGLSAAMDAATKAHETRKAYVDAYNAQLQKLKQHVAGEGAADKFANVGEGIVEDTAQNYLNFANNVSSFSDAIYTGLRYGWDSPQYQELNLSEQDTRRAIQTAQQLLNAEAKEQGSAARIVRGIGSGVAQLPKYLAAGPYGAGAVAFVDSLGNQGTQPSSNERLLSGDRSAELVGLQHSLGEGVKMNVLNALGGLAGGASSPVARQAIARTAGAGFMAGSAALEGERDPRALAEQAAIGFGMTGPGEGEGGTEETLPKVAPTERTARLSYLDMPDVPVTTPEAPRVVKREGLATLGELSPELRKIAAGTTEAAPEAASATESSRPTETPEQFRHAQFGLVTEASDQSGVRAGSVRVVDEQNGEHVIQRPNGRGEGNQLAVPVRARAEAEPTTPDVPAHVKDEIARITGQASSPAADVTVAEPPAHVREEIARITGTANAVTEAERAERGLAPVEKQAYAAMGDSYLRGREAVEQGRVDPRSLAQLVADNPRPLTSDEVGALGFDRARLKAEHRETLKAVSDAVDRGDGMAVAEGRVRLERVEKDLDSNDQALQKGGREQSAAFNARKMIVRDDYDLDTLVRRAKAAKGSDLTPAERGQFEELSRRLEEAERKVAERDEQLSKAQAERAARKLAADASGEARLEARRQRRVTTKQELDTQFADLRAQFAQARAEIKSTVQPSGLAGLDPEGKLTGLVIQMAKNRVRAGVVTAEGLVDEIYNALKDHVEGLTKRDIRDTISGYGKTAEMSQDPTAKSLRDLKQQMRLVSAIEDAEGGQKPQRSGLQREPQSAEARRLRAELYDKMKAADLIESRRLIGPKLSEGTGRKEGPRLTEAPLQGPRDWLPAAKQRLQSRIAELEGKIARGDFTKPESRPAVVYDREGNALKARVESLKRQIDDEIKKRETKGPLDYLVKWKRFAVLTHPTTFAKLAVAAAGRMVQTPIEEVTGGVLSKMPGVSKIAARAPREGGFNLRAEVNAISQLWQSDSFRAMLENLKVGRDDLDVLYGDKRAETEFSNLPGRGHAAVKVIPKRAEFFRSFEKRLAFAARQGSDISDPEVQAGVAMEAYADAKRAIFMQPNLLSDGFNSAMRWLERRGVSGKTVAALSRFEVPITKVPVNFVGETLSLDPVVGASKGLIRLAASGYREGRAKGAAKTTLMLDLSALRPEEADYVLRAWKKGLGIGLGMTVLGFLRPQNFGGYYQPGEKRDEKDAQAGEIVIGGYHIPRWATHVPLLEAAQFGATIRRVMDAAAQKEMRSPKDRSPVAEGVLAAGKGLTEEIPFFGLPKQIFQATEGGEKGLEKFGGEQVKSLIPGFVQDYAAYRDKDAKGQPAKRFPQGFTDEIKEGVPGLREQVPSSKLEPGFQRGVKPSDSVKAEMERLNVSAPDAGEKMTIGGRQFTLTPEQQQRYREAVKAEAYPRLERLFANPRYQSQTDDQKRKSVQGVIDLARAPAEAVMREELLPDNRRVQAEERKEARRAGRTTEDQFLRRQQRRSDRTQRRFFPEQRPTP
jgi:hypothetical protein